MFFRKSPDGKKTGVAYMNMLLDDMPEVEIAIPGTKKARLLGRNGEETSLEAKGDGVFTLRDVPPYTVQYLIAE